MKKLLYIYNPNAGRQQSRAVLAEALEALAGEGYQLTVYPTTGAGDATEAAFRLASDHDRLVCCGGDGTLNEVVSGLLRLPAEERPVLGYIPMGSANDFARNLNLPKTVVEQARLAATAEGRPVDIGNSSGHPFTYVTAFGLFTEVSYSTPQSMKNLLGHFAYLLEGAGQLLNVPSYHLTVETEDRGVIEGDFIYGMVSNTVSVGGVVSLPKRLVSQSDGQFEVVLIHRPRTLKDWQAIITAVADLRMPCSGALEAFTARKVTLRSEEPLAWTVDGEFGGDRLVTEIEVLPHAVRVAAGPTE